MAVVFDEVVATVDPEPEAGPAAAPDAGEQGGAGVDPVALRGALRRLSRRDQRLRAD